MQFLHYHRMGDFAGSGLRLCLVPCIKTLIKPFLSCIPIWPDLAPAQAKAILALGEEGVIFASIGPSKADRREAKGSGSEGIRVEWHFHRR